MISENNNDKDNNNNKNNNKSIIMIIKMIKIISSSKVVVYKYLHYNRKMLQKHSTIYVGETNKQLKSLFGKNSQEKPIRWGN